MADAVLGAAGSGTGTPDSFQLVEGTSSGQEIQQRFLELSGTRPVIQSRHVQDQMLSADLSLRVSGAPFFNLNSVSFCHLDDVQNLLVRFKFINTTIYCFEQIHVPEVQTGSLCDRQLIQWGQVVVAAPAMSDLSVPKEVSLAQWNQDVSSPPLLPTSSASSRIAYGALTTHDNQLCSASAGVSRSMRSMHGEHRRRASVNLIMGMDIPDEADSSIDGSDIVNMNRVFLNRASEVVRDSAAIGMTFVGPEGQLREAAERILRRQ